MATTEQIAELRRLIDEPDATVYTDVALSARLDASANDTDYVAGVIWREKAARYAGMIDVQEGNSSRKMSQLHTQALKMADSFVAGLDGVVDRRPARTRKIERQ